MSTATREVQFEANGLRSLRELRDGTAQPLPHSHNEVELLLLEKGGGEWLLGGETAQLKPGRLVVFWAVRPHQLVSSQPGTLLHCLTIPFTVFGGWELPGPLVKRLRAGHVLFEPDPACFAEDLRSFAHWHEDLRSPDGRRQRLALLEIRARLHRLGLRLEQAGAGRAHDHPPRPGLLNHGHFEKVSRIADFVAAHFSEDISIPEIARAAGMQATSATRLFKKICGLSLMHYLTQHRILHAQRLLATSDAKVADVAAAAGYRSPSRFYASFKAFCGVSPQDFRGSYDLRQVPLERPAGVWRVGRSRAGRNAPARLAQGAP